MIQIERSNAVKRMARAQKIHDGTADRKTDYSHPGMNAAMNQMPIGQKTKEWGARLQANHDAVINQIQRTCSIGSQIIGKPR